MSSIHSTFVPLRVFFLQELRRKVLDTLHYALKLVMSWNKMKILFNY